MKGFGLSLLALGVVLAGGALFMSTSVPTETPVGIYGRTTTSEIYNLGLLQHQMMIFVTGLATALAGVVLAAAGAAVETINSAAGVLPIASERVQTAFTEEVRPAAIEREFSPEELAERDRNLNRATFYVAGGMIAGLGVIFLIIMMAT